MEKQYLTPEMEITTFEAEDVITTSSNPPVWNDPDTPGGDGWG